MRLKSEAKEHFHSFKPQRTRQRGTRLVEKGRKGIGVRNVIHSCHFRLDHPVLSSNVQIEPPHGTSVFYRAEPPRRVLDPLISPQSHPPALV